MTDRRKKDEGEREEARRNEKEKREEGVESLALVWLRVSKWQQRTRAVIVFQPCRLATTKGSQGTNRMITMTTRTTWTWSWTQKTLVVCYFFAAVAVTSSHAQQRQAEEDCLSVVENVVNLCGGVLDSTDPFDLLNCCTEAQSANERKCFCDSSVALGLGSIYDVTLQVLDSG